MADSAESLFAKYITKESLESIFSEYFKRELRLNSFETGGPVDGVGFLSKINRVHLNWTNPDEIAEVPRRVIVKIRCDDGMMYSETMQKTDPTTVAQFVDSMKKVHPNECNFYSFLAPQLPVPTPRCYHANAQVFGFLLLEDLGEWYKEPNIVEGMSLEQLNEVADIMSRMHAWSLNNLDHDWINRFVPITEFANFYAYLQTLTGDILTHLKETFPGYFDFLDMALVDVAFDQRAFKEPSGPPLVTHGDFWLHNILVDKETQKIGSIIDWQFTNKGTFGDDLARLMVYSVNPDIRRSQQVGVLRRYYESLKKMVKTENQHFVPEFHVVYSAYEQRFAREAFYVLCDCSLLLEECAAIGGDEKTQTKNSHEIVRRASATLEDAQRILLKGLKDCGN